MSQTHIGITPTKQLPIVEVIEWFKTIILRRLLIKYMSVLLVISVYNTLIQKILVIL